MRYGVVAGFGALLCLSAPVQADLLVSVSKSQQRVAVVVNGAETYRWPVSTGKRGHETPSGTFRPIRLERHWYSRQYELTPMPWAMFFHRGYALHGTMEAYNLGRAASHGCVRLRPDNAATLFSLMRRQGLDNTKIVVKDGALPAAPNAAPSQAEALPTEDATLTHFASANDGVAQDYAAKAHSGDEVVERKPGAIKISDVETYRVSAGSDEAQILRERAAWLRGLDRKYGITR
jgi:L,D-transpeptidase catalytic domain